MDAHGHDRGRVRHMAVAAPPRVAAARVPRDLHHLLHPPGAALRAPQPHLLPRTTDRHVCRVSKLRRRAQRLGPRVHDRQLRLHRAALPRGLGVRGRVPAGLHGAPAARQPSLRARVAAAPVARPHRHLQGLQAALSIHYSAAVECLLSPSAVSSIAIQRRHPLANTIPIHLHIHLHIIDAISDPPRIASVAEISSRSPGARCAIRHRIGGVVVAHRQCLGQASLSHETSSLSLSLSRLNASTKWWPTS